MKFALVKSLPPFVALVLLIPICLSIVSLRDHLNDEAGEGGRGVSEKSPRSDVDDADSQPMIQLIENGTPRNITKNSTVATTRDRQLELLIPGGANLAEAPTVTGGLGVRLGPTLPTRDGSYRRPLKVTFDGDADLTIATVNRLGARRKQVITFQQQESTSDIPVSRPAAAVR